MIWECTWYDLNPFKCIEIDGAADELAWWTIITGEWGTPRWGCAHGAQAAAAWSVRPRAGHEDWEVGKEARAPTSLKGGAMPLPGGCFGERWRWFWLSPRLASVMMARGLRDCAVSRNYRVRAGPAPNETFQTPTKQPVYPCWVQGCKSRITFKIF